MEIVAKVWDFVPCRNKYNPRALLDHLRQTSNPEFMNPKMREMNHSLTCDGFTLQMCELNMTYPHIKYEMTDHLERWKREIKFMFRRNEPNSSTTKPELQFIREKSLWLKCTYQQDHHDVVTSCQPQFLNKPHLFFPLVHMKRKDRIKFNPSRYYKDGCRGKT